MRKVILFTTMILFLSITISAMAQVTITVPPPPPPPGVRVTVPLPPPIVFPAPPEVVVLPETEVYAVPSVPEEIFFYNGYWWSPERKALQVLIDHTQQSVNGWVRVKLYKGSVSVVGRDSKTDSLFDPTIATFEDDAGAYDQKDAAGFIKLNALRMRIAENARLKRSSRAKVRKG